jgi:uncharacterized protein
LETDQHNLTIPSASQGDDASLPRPTAEPERIQALDTLRGVALLGILGMNIRSFAGPFSTYMNPLLMYEYQGLSRAAFWLTALVFDTKMMSLFSILFGAGSIVYATKGTAHGRSPTRLWFRRNVWLLAIGMVHAYLLWDGDILVTYACCGLLFLWWTRRLPPWALVAIASFMLLVGAFFQWGHAAEFEQMSAEKKAAELEFWQPTPEQIAKDVAAHRGPYLSLVFYRAPGVFEFQTVVFVFYFLWRAGAMMVLGQALMKLGVLSGARPARFYLALAAAGYTIGSPFVWVGIGELERIQFAVPGRYLVDLYNYFGSVAVALGHAGLILWLQHTGGLGRLADRLAAVGRMAFTNYLAQSLICTTLFYGYGLGLFGRLDYVWQLLVLIGVWSLQLLYSPWWLARAEFGPFEWLWRWLTYGTRPAFLRRRPASQASGQAS